MILMSLGVYVWHDILLAKNNCMFTLSLSNTDDNSYLMNESTYTENKSSSMMCVCMRAFDVN